MLVGDLVYNESFDFDCDYEIYDQQRGRGASPIFSKEQNHFRKPPYSVLDMEIEHIEVRGGTIIVSARTR